MGERGKRGLSTCWLSKMPFSFIFLFIAISNIFFFWRNNDSMLKYTVFNVKSDLKKQTFPRNLGNTQIIERYSDYWFIHICSYTKMINQSYLSFLIGNNKFDSLSIFTKDLWVWNWDKTVILQMFKRQFILAQNHKLLHR